MQIKSRTETKWGNLKAEHEIMFYSSHPGPKQHGNQETGLRRLMVPRAKYPPLSTDVRVRRGKQN